MTRWPLRLAQYALVLWVALTLNFALPRLAPGDPLEFLVGPELASLSAGDRARLREDLGLDAPLVVQYARYLAGVASLDLGRSFRRGLPVVEILLDRLQWTLLLTLPALLLSTLIGTALGAYAAWRRQRRGDLPWLVGMLALDALPPFWIGMVVIAVFAGWLGWLPASGSVVAGAARTGLAGITDVLSRVAMPLLTMTLAAIPYTFFIARASLITTLGEDYVTLAEAKGLTARQVLFRHALPNALLPVFTFAALSLGSLAGGAVVIETVFGYPGLGRLLTEAVAMRDYPLLQGGLLLMTVGVIAGNAAADLTYPLIDPRVRVRR